MPISLTVAYVKEQFLTDMTRTDHDTMLGDLITDVVARAVEYIDDTNVIGQSTLPATLQRPLAKQVAYEYRRRSDVGLQSVTFPDGSVNKFNSDEWLDDVLTVLDRSRYHSFGDQE
jgi:hypothetical protein